MSFFGNVLGFEKNLLGQRWGEYKKNPERLLLGINTPMESKLWGGVLGKKYDATMDMWGGPTQKQYQTAQDAGIDTRAGKGMHDIAHVIAAMYTGKYAKAKLGGSAPTDGGGGSNPWIDRAQQFSNMMPNQQQQSQQMGMPIDYAGIQQESNANINKLMQMYGVNNGWLR